MLENEALVALRDRLDATQLEHRIPPRMLLAREGEDVQLPVKRAKR
jgi:hypothetical protein